MFQKVPFSLVEGLCSVWCVRGFVLDPVVSGLGLVNQPIIVVYTRQREAYIVIGIPSAVLV